MKKLLLSLTFVAATYMAQGQVISTFKTDSLLRTNFKIDTTPRAIFVFGNGQEGKINIQYKEDTYHLLDTTYTAENNKAYMAIRSICEIEKVNYQMVIKFSYTGSFWRFHSVVVEPFKEGYTLDRSWTTGTQFFTTPNHILTPTEKTDKKPNKP